MITDKTLQQYLRQWEAIQVPFGELNDEKLFVNEAIDKTQELLNQCVALRSIMLLTGPNGVGKSCLVGNWRRNLNPKEYLPLVITQASINAVGILGLLLNQLGKPLRLRRSDNLSLLDETFKELGTITPVLILDDAQQYGAVTLEEVRLLLGLNLPKYPTFALILVGDDYLLRTLGLQSNRALFSRVALKYELPILDRSAVADYVRHRFKAAGILRDCLEETALDLIHAASQGVQRTINLVARQAWILASQQNQSIIGPEHVQKAIEIVPSAKR